MNTNYQSNAKTTRFSDEIEGEGMELFLRGFLVACLLTALAISNLSIGVSRHNQSTSADRQAKVALVKVAAQPVAEL